MSPTPRQTLVCALAVLTVASHALRSTAACGLKFEQFSVLHAKLFNVTWLEEGAVAVIDVAAEPGSIYWSAYPEHKYVITPCANTSAAQELVPGATEYISVASSIAVKTTTVVALVDAVDAHTLIVAYADAQYTSSQRVLDHINDQSIPSSHTLGWPSNVNVTTLKLQDTELHLTDHSNCVSDRNDLVGQGIPTVCIPSSREETPLGKAEWMKVVGLLTGQEGASLQEFGRVAGAYEDATLFASAASKKTVVDGLYSSFSGGWSMSWSTSYIATHYSNAGGEYVVPDSYVANSLASVDVAKATWALAEFWVSSGGISSILANDDEDVAWIRTVPAVTCGNVFEWTKRSGIVTSGNDWFESADVKPDFVLKDIIKMMHPELLPGWDFYYLQKIDVSAYHGSCPFEITDADPSDGNSDTKKGSKKNGNKKKGNKSDDADDQDPAPGVQNTTTSTTDLVLFLAIGLSASVVICAATAGFAGYKRGRHNSQSSDSSPNPLKKPTLADDKGTDVSSSI